MYTLNEPMMVRILRGVMALDRHFDGRANWIHKIHPQTLNLAEYDLCIIGQVFDIERRSDDVQYETATSLLGLTSDQDECDHGFKIGNNTDYSWEELTQGWMIVLGFEVPGQEYHCTECECEVHQDIAQQYAVSIGKNRWVVFCSPSCRDEALCNHFRITYNPTDAFNPCVIDDDDKLVKL